MTDEINWQDVTVPIEKMAAFTFREMKMNYKFHFHNGGEIVGELDFNGPQMKFTGDLEESGRVFFEYLANMFQKRLEQERAAEREACAKVVEASPSYDWHRFACEAAAAIRARSNTNS